MKGQLPLFVGPWRTFGLCALFVVLVVAAAWIGGRAVGPFEADPDYIYLINGLELLTLHSPAYYTHPGTPVEIIVAIVTAIVWLMSAPWFGDIRDQVLANPGLYLGWINVVFVAAVAASLAFFACRVWRATGRIFPGLAGGLTVFLPLPVFLAVHRVTPEPLLLAGGLVLAGLVAPLAFAPEASSTAKRLALWVGAALGFCIAVKATAAPLLIATLFLRGKSARLVALSAALLTGVILTLPVASNYLEMVLWYVGLFTHHGSYGSGAAAAPSGAELLADAASLAGAMPEVFACLAVYLIFLLMRPKRSSEQAMRALLLCTVLVLIILLAVLKQPVARYTIPAVPFLCLGNAIVAESFFASAAWLRSALLAVLAVADVWLGMARMDHVRDILRGNSAVLQQAQSSNCLAVPYYGANTVLNNLYFGDGWARYIYKDHLARLYPDFVYFNNTSGKFETFSDPMTRSAARSLLARQSCVYLIGSPVERMAGFPIGPRYLSLVARSRGNLQEAIALYRLDPRWIDSVKARD